MTIRLDHGSEQARNSERAFLDLVAAGIGDRDVYLSELQRVLNEMLSAREPVERVVYILDAAAQVTKSSLRAWAALVNASEQDLMHLLESEWPTDSDAI